VTQGVWMKEGVLGCRRAESRGGHSRQVRTLPGRVWESRGGEALVTVRVRLGGKSCQG